MIIQVELEVSRHIVRGDMIEIWGYVGDYEVMVVLKADDPRVTCLVEQEK